MKNTLIDPVRSFLACTKKKSLTFMRGCILLVWIFFIGGLPVSAEEIIQDNNNGMIVRISEIEVYPEYLEEYLNYAKEVALLSVAKEKGVVCIYPMQVMKDKSQIRILEIYKNQEAYQSHIASSHFKQYKEGTLRMVKHLDLVDTSQLCPENFHKIFKKAEN